MRFADKVCIVTGGGSGIGRATCERLASEGGRIVVVDLSFEAASDTVDALTEAGFAAIPAVGDVAVAGTATSAVDAALRAWRRLDVVVNNAATMSFGAIADVSEDVWDRVLAVNLRGPFLLCKYALPHMQGGAIVNVSSVHAHRTTANVVPYAASKAGLEAFGRGLALECEGRGVRVNTVAPGATDTPMLASNPNLATGAEAIDERDVASPTVIAAAIAFLASDDASSVNGATLVVDRGRLAAL